MCQEKPRKSGVPHHVGQVQVREPGLVKVGIWNVPQRPTCGRLGPQPKVTSGGDGFFRRCGLEGGSELGACPSVGFKKRLSG